jgi:methylated-DNA-[protein]-cysteine S-methyltransferase
VTASTRPRWWKQETPVGELLVVSGKAGVERIWFDREPLDRAALDVVAFVGDAREGRDRTVARQLDEWFAGSRRTFSLAIAWPPDLSPFARTVLETLVARVPWGETVSYGELAELAGRARAARAVGSIMAGNTVPFVVPCHRVIAAGGRIGGYGGGRDAIGLKRWLLEREGVQVRGCPPAREVAIPSNP